MRRLILQTGISIDGYVAALDGSHPWSGGEDEAVKRWILDSVWAAGAHLMGRVTYEEMAAFWPTSTSDYARPMNEIPKVVFSKTLERLHSAPGSPCSRICALRCSSSSSKARPTPPVSPSTSTGRVQVPPTSRSISGSQRMSTSRRRSARV